MLQVKPLRACRRRAFGLMAGVALSCTLLAACSDEQADSSAQSATSESTSDIEAAESSGTDENETKKSETSSTARDSSTDGSNDGDSKPIPPNVVLDSDDGAGFSEPRNSNSSGSSKSRGGDSCGSNDAQTAFSIGEPQLDRWGGFGWELIDTSGYDSCAALSWQTVMIEGGTSSSPFHIMLFHHGEFLGTATAKAYGFMPTVQRMNSSEIAVTYHWPREGEGNANRSGTTEAGFRWDDAQQKVVMSGNVPPER